MPEYVLHYFNIRARGEPIRMLLAYKGVSYRDHRIEFSDWPALKPKTPTGTLPVLFVDNRIEIAQSVPILRYLARQYDLLAGEPLQDARLDMICDFIGDVISSATKFFQEKDESKKAEIGENLAKNELPERMETLDKLLKVSAMSPFAAGSKVTWTDFFIACNIEFIDTAFLKGAMPKDLLDYVKRVQSLPGVKEHVASRPASPF